MNKWTGIGLGLLLFLNTAITAQRLDNREIEKINHLLYFINANYVDTVNTHELVEEGIRSMLKKLDPHSVYISKEELREMDEPLVGNFDGIGIQFNILDDTIVVVNPIVGGPSAKLGIMAGDKIIVIENETVAGIKIKQKDVLNKLRGPKGTVVNVGIKRKGERDLLKFTITRDKIPLYSIDATYMVDKETGYVKISRFSATTSKEFVEALEKLQSQGMKNLILDLTGNGGGYLTAATELVDQFFDENKVIVFTKGRNTTTRSDYKTTASGSFKKGRLVVMIDEGSASASEIVSGAVQDYDRGLLVGRRSFGKGLVQNSYPLPDGSAIRLTTARYYTPSGRCIQKPYENGVDDYYEDLNKRFLHGEFTHKDSIQFADSLKFYTIGKRLVYGGGGIMPDVFVPLDTSENSKYLNEVYRKGLFNKFVLKYVDNNRDELKQLYPDFKTFNGTFITTNEIVNQFVQMAEAEGVQKNLADLIKSEEFIKRQLKALIANQIWGIGEYYQAINPFNPVYREAVKMIKGDEFKKLKIKS